MKTLKEYAFVDCLLINFNVDKRLSILFVVVEAYYSISAKEKRKKGLLKITFNGINQITLKKNQEFDFDVALPYDESGSHVKANEVYSVEVLNLKGGICKGLLKSDMLDFELQFQTLSLEELN